MEHLGLGTGDYDLGGRRPPLRAAAKRRIAAPSAGDRRNPFAYVFMTGNTEELSVVKRFGPTDRRAYFGRA